MKRILILLLILFGISFLKANAQNGTGDNLPYVINSAGGYGIINGQMFDFNLGELVLTETFSGLSGYLFSQGFLQPFFIVSTSGGDVLIGNNVITPNGDGKNDVFIVKGLDKYPENKIGIYDRAGRRIFNTNGYKNNWDGMYNGQPLAEGAYIYIIDLGKGLKPLKGTVNIVRDLR